MSGHGGARRGAGRPLKWRFDDVLTIGQACETLWREASELALKTRLAALPHAAEIRSLQEGAQAIPVPQRRGWLEGDGYEAHSGDVAAWLHARAGTPFNDEAGDYEGDAPRVVTVSTRPPRGTRKRIIAEIAGQNGLPESAVDNLWQAYRRFERDLGNYVAT